VVIYAQHDIDTCDIHCYEVFVVLQHNGYVKGKNYIEPGEYKPSTTMWGKLAFSPSTLEKAKERASQLAKKLEMQSQVPSRRQISKIIQGTYKGDGVKKKAKIPRT